MVSFLARRPEQGADSLVWLADSADAGRFSGQYFVDRKPSRPNPPVDPSAAARLWRDSEAAVAEWAGGAGGLTRVSGQMGARGASCPPKRAGTPPDRVTSAPRGCGEGRLRGAAAP